MLRNILATLFALLAFAIASPNLFADFLETEAALSSSAAVEGPPAMGSPGPDGVPVDMEYIHNSSSYSWCVVA